MQLLLICGHAIIKGRGLWQLQHILWTMSGCYKVESLGTLSNPVYRFTCVDCNLLIVCDCNFLIVLIVNIVSCTIIFYRFAHVQCPHTSVVLADAMMDCILDWHIEKKVSALTVDNCSTNNAMIPIILDKLSSDSTLLNGEMFHMHCSAHILNLIVKDGLDVINDSIDRIRGSVSYWTASPKREEKFLETVRELEIVSTKKLALDCKTRWNSTFALL